MTKAPRPGHVKTRLVPPLTPEQAAELNKCFLQDTAAAISACCHQRAVGDARAVAVYTPVGAEVIYADILPPDFFLVPQRGEHFGDRLSFATADLFDSGFQSVCLIDSDSPTVPALAYQQAVEKLSAPGDRVVLGPTGDGGYYLIGLKQPSSILFERIDWSTERVFEQTLQRAAEVAVGVEFLAIGFDVDDRASLERLRNELFTTDAAKDIAPATRRFLATLRDKF
ncbi:MAG: TIGR04282 family arsenosugar biosynthesis glycosyltransferase [Chthoniobacterales bacterium]